MRYRDYKSEEYTKKEIKENDKNLYLYESTLDNSSTTYTKAFEGLDNTFPIPSRKTNGRGDDTFFGKTEHKKFENDFKELFTKLKDKSKDYNTILFPTDFGQFTNNNYSVSFKNYLFKKLETYLPDSKNFFTIYRK